MLSKSNILLFILISMLSLARFLYLGSVPGLHGDEALYGIKTYLMMHGNFFTLNGFNSYTGPIVSYLRIPFFYFFGVNVFSLRLPVVILSLISIFFAYKILAEIYNHRTGVIAALLLLTMPWSFIYSRFSDETQVTLIFFAIGGLYYLYRASIYRKGRDKMLASLFFGIGVFNHIIFVITVISCLLYFLIKSRFRMDRSYIAPVIIFFIFLFSRVFLIFKGIADGASGVYYRLGQAIGQNLTDKVIYSGSYFMQMLDGSIFYKRITGDLLLYVIPLNSVLFAIAFISIIFRRRDKVFVWIFILSCLINIIFLHVFSLRYFMVTLMFAAILMAIFLGTFDINRWLRVGLVAIMLISNCLYTAYNYFYSFKKSEGRILSFWAGNFYENSMGFVDSTALYGYLKEKGYPHIWVPEKFIGWALMFLDLEEKRLNIGSREDSISTDIVYFVSYKDDSPKRYDLKGDYSISKEQTLLKNYDVFVVTKK